MNLRPLEKYAEFLITAINTVVKNAILKSRREHSKNNSISDETVALIKKKYRPRRQYSQRSTLFRPGLFYCLKV